MSATIQLTIVQGQDGEGVILPLADSQGEPIPYAEGWKVVAKVTSTGGMTMKSWNSEVNDDAEIINHNGNVAVKLTWGRADTENWRTKKGLWEVFVIDPLGKYTKVCSGPVVIDLSI